MYFYIFSLHINIVQVFLNKYIKGKAGVFIINFIFILQLNQKYKVGLPQYKHIKTVSTAFLTFCCYFCFRHSIAKSSFSSVLNTLNYIHSLDNWSHLIPSAEICNYSTEWKYLNENICWVSVCWQNFTICRLWSTVVFKHWAQVRCLCKNPE